MSQTLQSILCVDDEDDILEIETMCLETIGSYKVTIAKGGENALQLAPELQPDVILLDVMMPGMDGMETITKLKNNDITKHIPVIFMSARVQPAEIEEYIQLGAIGVIPKPFDPMELSAQVEALWDEKK